MYIIFPTDTDLAIRFHASKRNKCAKMLLLKSVFVSIAVLAKK